MPFQIAAGRGAAPFRLKPYSRTRLLAAAAVALMGSTSLAAAQTTPAPQRAQTGGVVRSFDIAAQPLSSAVGVFSRQSGLQVTLASATARGITTRAVRGSLTPEQALGQMLGGTGINFRLSGNTVVIGQTPGGVGVVGVEGAIALDAVDVSGAASHAGYQGAPDWIYDTPASISYIGRSAILETTPRSASDLFDGMAGVNTVGTPQDPGITVNVRGLQDQNRVTSTIDGARQNFQMSGHANTGLVYVDPLLLRAVEVDKSMAAGVGAGGSHGSVVAFRTLSAQDLIQPGKDWGAELDLTTGTNAYTFYGLAAVAGRVGKVDAAFAITHKELGEYNIGHNGTLQASSGILAQYAANSSAIFTGSDTWSGLAKLGWDITEDQRLEAGFVVYDTEFSTSTALGTYPDTNKLLNLTGTLTYTWRPDNGWIDLKAQLWANRTDVSQYRDERATYGAFDVDYGLDSYGGSIVNTSTFAVPYGKLAVNYGVEAFYDKGSTNSVAYDADDADEGWWFSGTNPNGERWLATPFAKATFTHGEWLEVSAGGRYDYYKLTGSSTVYGGTETVVITPAVCLLYFGSICRRWSTAVTEQRRLTEDINVDQSGGHFSPEATVAVTPLTGFQVYGKYTGGYRPPGLSEALLGGQHIGAIFNYIPNPNLRPETSQNWEIGVNMKYDNVLRNNDTFRFKAAYFDRTIENFIVLAPSSLIVSPTTGNRYSGFQAVNLTNDAKLSGIEIEGNYDAGDYYVGGSYTLTNSEYSQEYISGDGTPYAYTTDGIYFLSVAPEQKFTMDVGLRQFDRRWVIGGKVTHVVPAEQLGINAVSYEPTVYTVWDVYSSLKLSEQATLRFAVTNLTDVAYVDAMNSYDFPAPGRTATVSLNLKF
ncbi:ligand-gated channel [Azorhizobium oxalatiphilum]|uniref:Ligand-gated channel n=1 Tax=Azorhizobium oxalatiphilum TaxID=980631 RepID=A0A917C2V8_9HYPH|nr:TonB-dependent receptor [Azorhizobium oxalatiphilum]GGF69115.1 ligand-gated channel [Azorhizobium oxalatiphilum]